ncbi:MULTISPECIES: hypothetical protein [Streptomyces]|uniref:hypothetical protein n=1 Tax=Streptomyces TaxID=1883 RepID=UPI0006E46A3C|nr:MULTISPECIES: hypothetical protein [Streptomyces]MBX9427525.1 hypothetical protein [Streptomyces lateritius]
MAGVLHLTRLRCVKPDDSDVDEVKLQIDGKQVWPNEDDGYFSMGTDNEVPMDIGKFFRGRTVVALYDDENVGADSRLGEVEFEETSRTPGVARIYGNSGSKYELWYEIFRVGG